LQRNEGVEAERGCLFSLLSFHIISGTSCIVVLYLRAPPLVAVRSAYLVLRRKKNRPIIVEATPSLKKRKKFVNL
jgi:Fe2+ transport system protein FeoA